MRSLFNKTVDIAIIGGGPGGLGAAIRAKEEGAKDVVLIERAEELGGMLTQCIHNGFGLHYFGEELSGPAYMYKLIKKAEKAGVEFLTYTMVVKLKGTSMTALSKKGVINIEAKAIILAMGARERTREAIRIPGERPAGIFNAGTAQRLINVEGFIPGKSIVILGSGDIGMIMARRLTFEGARVIAMVEALPFIGGLIRNEVQCLRDFNIPVYTKHTVSNIIGKDRIKEVVITEVDSKITPVPGTEKEIKCDTLLLSVGLIPENELSVMSGVKLNKLTGGPIVDNLWQTDIEGVFAAGNVVHIHDLADYVTESSEMAAVNAVKFSKGKIEINYEIPVEAGDNIRYVAPNKLTNITKNEPVSFYMRVSWPLKNATVHIGDLYTKKFRFVRPSEQIRIDLELDKVVLPEKILISCEGEEDISR
jgi:thioredoxin reductase